MRLISTPTASIVDVLRRHAEVQPNRTALRFLPAAGAPIEVTFKTLDRAAAALASTLRSRIRPGDRVLLFYPPGPEFVTAFFGVLYAGAIAVPLVPPRRHGGRHVMAALIGNAQPTSILTTSALAARVNELLSEIANTLRPIATDDLVLDPPCEDIPSPSPDSVCVLQYTSGSTGTPRGVMVTHENIGRNSLLLARTAEVGEQSVWVSWVPHFHDLGLLGSICTPLYNGFETVLMPPAVFVTRPLRWLEAITEYGGTVTVAPNFAYDLCVRETKDKDCSHLDLSRWRVAGCGAEPIRMETLNGFAERFAPHGFRRQALCPFYGLAEATLLVGGGPVGIGQTAAKVSSRALRERNCVAPPVGNGDTYAVPSCGRPSPEHRLLVVDPKTKLPCVPDTIGEIWIDGSTTGPGYWNQAQETARVFGARLATGEGPFLRTGDLGFLRDGVLYITGRIKDLIILRGQNFYPQDIEATARAVLRDVPEAAAFALEGADTEQAVLVIEQPRAAQGDPQSMFAALREAVWLTHGVELAQIVLTRRRALPKTSSGKLQRSAARAALIGGSLPVLAEWRAQDSSEQTEAAAAVPAVPFTLQLRRLTQTEQRRAITDYLVDIVAGLLGIGADECDRDTSLMAMGATSLGIMRLKRRIETDFMITLDADVVWRETGIGGLALPLHQALLASPLWANAEAMAGLAAEIAGMSDEEVSRELAVEPVA